MRLAINKIRAIARKVYFFVRPETLSTRYLDFKIVHDKYDSLINEINKNDNKVYEETESLIIVNHLKIFSAPTVLDIGANIGLMSLNLCHYLKNSVIYAIEPGPMQFNYLFQNIKRNGLQKRIIPFNIALSSSSGPIDFHTHAAKDSSGDGILDTGRAGLSKVIKVDSMTLDEWWDKQKQPPIHFIKLDTEGAELQILNFATRLIRKYRPPILIEICYLNYEKYGLQFEDYLNALDNLDYSLFDLKERDHINLANFNSYKDHFYYLANPNSINT